VVEVEETAASGAARIFASLGIVSHGGRVSHTTDDPEEVAFPAVRYDRVCRTAESEAYLLSEGDAPFGRVDLHFGGSIVHGVLIVERELSDDDVHGLVQRIDDDLVWTADRAREDFVVTVYQGTERGVISDSEDDDSEQENDDDDDEA
jgi:hypothetical protein